MQVSSVNGDVSDIVQSAFDISLPSDGAIGISIIIAGKLAAVRYVQYDGLDRVCIELTGPTAEQDTVRTYFHYQDADAVAEDGAPQTLLTVIESAAASQAEPVANAGGDDVADAQSSTGAAAGGATDTATPVATTPVQATQAA